MQQKEAQANITVKSNPLVSIVCVTYNAAQTLPELIKSKAANKTPEIEFIVIDGGSTDDTISILKANDTVIDNWISETDKGIYDAMNKSINYINRQWVIFLGADDTLQEDFIKMLPLLKDPDTIYYGNVI